ncbi:DNA-processing protein DprA [Pollutimonas bauzanensis]|uniref:DNA protecting protein DprA n=1 Tax=Pollutimonas bauzanensis TaxID=658167 RepID=A0A1M5SYW3_9BURK|nr:DNA-processing protein DprA [Pollutimonas bauzanensis]SHH43528.1 DNA protecting protein DprA [Pollutimonas bauzanensis]
MHPTLSTEELSAWIRLSLEPGLGPASARNLLAAIGLPQDIYALSTSALRQFLPDELARQLRQAPGDDVLAAVQNTLKWLEHPGHHLLTLADPAYPLTLLDIHDPPLLLYANGDPARLDQPVISIVGARSASAGGADNARAFARHLAEQGWCIASGLALGIDTAAHEGALLAGPAGAGTIAVLGTGIDIVYPARNRELARRIAQEGVLISEFPMGRGPLPRQFPQRNRLVAGLARGVLVVEAARHSGSLITARLASEMGREVFAIPGSIHSPLSRGCHALIRQGAKLVESAQDIREELGSSGVAAAPPAQGQPRRKGPAAGPAAQAVLEALGYDPVHLDTLHERSQLDLATLTTRLLELELQEIVVRLDDGRYQRR